MATLHHRFTCYWKEVEGDVIASYALLNSYQSYRLGVMTSKHDKIQKQSKKGKKDNKLDGSLFLKDSVVKYFQEIDDKCRKSLEAVFEEFQDYSLPVVVTPDMTTFIEQMPAVIGRTWEHLCDLQGVKEKQAAEQEKNIPRKNSVFFQILSNHAFVNAFSMALKI